MSILHSNRFFSSIIADATRFESSLMDTTRFAALKPSVSVQLIGLERANESLRAFESLKQSYAREFSTITKFRSEMVQLHDQASASVLRMKQSIEDMGRVATLSSFRASTSAVAVGAEFRGITQEWSRRIADAAQFTLPSEWTTRLLEGLRPPQIDFERWRRASGNYCDVMFRLGWPPPCEVSSRWVFKIARLADLPDDELEKYRDTIESGIVQLYGDHMIESIRRRWESSPLAEQRVRILRAALDAHQNGIYETSIPTLVPQVEGFLVFGFAYEGRVNGKRLRCFVERLIDQEDSWNAHERSVQRFIMEHYLANFEHGAPIVSPLSRHAILHGADLSYPTVENSLRAILLLDQLLKLMKYVASEDSGVYHLNGGCGVAQQIRSERRIFFERPVQAENTDRRPCMLCRPAAEAWHDDGTPR